jgi:hypothetical protein
MLRSLVFIPVLAVGFAVPVTAQQKADIPKEGKYDITSCSVSTVTSIEFSKTYSAASWEAMGTSRSNPPGGFLDMTTFRCVGFTGTIAGKTSLTYMCEAIDKDGDKMLSRVTSDGSKATLDTVAGTGKYEGIVRTGVIEALGPFPVAKPGTSQTCNNGSGTYKMRSEATGSTTPPTTAPSK